MVRVAGGWVRPNGPEQPEQLYTVRFTMEDLWGADAERGWLHIDLWEGYLE